MKRRILSLLCAAAILMGMVTVPAFAAETEDILNDTRVLFENAENLTVDEDTTIDLNGYSIAGVTVAEGATLSVKDTKTEDFTVADGIYGKITGINGTVQAADGYMQITGEDAVSFHRVDLRLNGMALRPGNAGVYYTSLFAGDEMVAQQVETFGVALSVSTEPTEKNMDSLCAYSAFTGFVGGNTGNQTANGTLLTGIMKPTNSDGKNTWYAGMNVYGRAYVKTADGYIFGDCVARNLIQQVEAIDTVWASLSAVQKGNLLAMYETYESVMTLWNVPNMKNAFENPGMEEPDDDTVIVLPIPVAIADGKVTEDTTVTKDGYSVTVPAGVQLATDETELTLVITVKDSSDSGVTLEENQVLLPLDVHVEGVSEANTVPLTISLGKQLPENLNLGNYGAYHVENGNANEMTLIPMDALFTAHNQYKYTLDGEIILHIATFSEIPLVYDTEAKWEGEVDHSWYTKNPVAEVFEIRNADQLWSFSQIVGGMAKDNEGNAIAQDSFEGKTVKLLSDIDLNDGEKSNQPWIFYPIGYYNSEGTYEKDPNATEGVTSGFKTFEGTFDGNGNTISNIYQNTWEMKGDHDWYDAKLQYFRDGMGLFGKVYGGTVKNLTVDNFKSDGEITTTGVIAAYADCGAVFENIAIFDCNPRVYNIGNGGIVGCAGWYAKTEVEEPITFKNITVDNSNKISALWGTYDVSCGGILGQYYPTSGQTGSPKNGGIKMENCHVAAIMDVNNDVCGNYQYYWYRYCGMFIGTIRANKTEGNYTVADTTGITATGCTYTLAQWNQYYYCELVANSQASYTHDHQFSRLTTISSLSDIQDESGNWNTAGNFLIIDGDTKTCYHIVKDGETFKQHLHTDAGYEESIDEDGDGNVDLKEDKQIVYLPFNQLMTGLGWGVKAHQEFAGIEPSKDQIAQSSEKFTAVMEQHSIIPTSTTSIAVSELFEAKEDAVINESTVHVYISPVGDESTVQPAYVCVTNNNLDAIENLPISGTGAAKITITDYYFCTPTVLNVTVAEPADVEKFKALEGIEVNAEEPVELSKLFKAVEGVEIDGANVTVASDSDIVYDQNADDWTKGTVTFNKTGSVDITITDNNRCVTATATVTVKPINKFKLVFENTEKYLYRVGNASGSTVALNLLFESLEGVTVSSAEIEFETVAGNARGTYTPNATWTNGTIQFSGTGVIKVTIKATNAKPLILNLEVVDAVNATTAESATANNVVLLKDCGFGSLTVSKGYTFYGNGFELKNTADSYAVDRSYAFVTLDSGTLDNVSVICPNFSHSILYDKNKSENGNPSYSNGTRTWYYNIRSAVVMTGTSRIVNSYVAGGRAAVYVTSGYHLIENSTVYGGAAANIHVEASCSEIVLRDVTLVQKPIKATVNDTTKTVMGLSVVNICTGSGTPIRVEGELVQYAWANEEYTKYVPSEQQSVVKNLLSNSDYIHSITYDDGVARDSLNMGFLYLPEGVLNVGETNIDDNRTNSSSVPYGEVVVQNAALVYSYKSISGTHQDFATEPIYESQKQGNIQGEVQFAGNEEYITFESKFDADLGLQNKVSVDLDSSGGAYTFNFSSLLVQKDGRELTYSVLNTDGTSVDKALNIELSDSQTLNYVLRVEDTMVYDVDGNLIESEPIYYDLSFALVATKTSIEKPSVLEENYLTALQVEKSKDGEWNIALPALDGIKVRYYSTVAKDYKEEYLTDICNIADLSLGAQEVTGTDNNVWVYEGTDFRLTITSTTGKTGYFALPHVVNNNGTRTLYFVVGDSNGLCGTGTSSRDITLTYNFYDKNDGNCEFKHQWSQSRVSGKNNTTYLYSDFIKGIMTVNECITADSMITLADGTQKRVDELSGTEELLVWNLETGRYDAAPIVFVDSDAECEYEVIRLVYSDGTEVEVIYEHGFFDVTTGEYVYLDAYNAENYIGHSFIKQGDIAQNTWETVDLTDVVIETKVTTAYSPVTFSHLCYYVDGMLSMPGGIEGLFNIFAVDVDTMSYDAEKMAADIETYGLFTYEDFAALIPEEAFYAFNGAWLKVAMGKGMLTWEDIEYMANRYVPLM